LERTATAIATNSAIGDQSIPRQKAIQQGTLVGTAPAVPCIISLDDTIGHHNSSGGFAPDSAATFLLNFVADKPGGPAAQGKSNRNYSG
jgi:hypothetical protein